MSDTEDKRPDGPFKYAGLRVENAGSKWRAVYEEEDNGKCVFKATPWRVRERFWADLGEILGMQKLFVFRGMGSIPLALNPKSGTQRG